MYRDCRKPLFLLLVPIVIALALAGCERPKEARTLTIALAVFPDEASRYRFLLHDFESREHVKVNLIAQSYGDILRALLAEATAHRGRLDIVELDLAALGRAHEAARDLEAVVSPQARSLFPRAAWDAARFGDHVRFVPHRLMWQAMIYNRVRVPNPPRTWDELLAFARAHPGKVALKAARYEGATCDMLCFVWAAGGDLLAPRSFGALRAFDFLTDLAPYLNLESSVFREMSVLEAQARGSVWIHFNWPFAIQYLASKGLAPRVDLSAPIPVGPSGAATPLGGGYLAIPVSAPHPELAARFLQYLLAADVQRRLSGELGWYGSVAPPEGSEEARLYSGFAAMRPYVKARPTIACYSELSNSWQRAFRAVLVDGIGPVAALDRVASFARTEAMQDATRDCECH